MIFFYMKISVIYIMIYIMIYITDIIVQTLHIASWRFKHESRQYQYHPACFFW